MEPVTKQIRWPQLFGAEPEDMPEKTRRQRWEEWKRLLIKDGEQEMVDYWAKDHVDESCAGCIHRDQDWCGYSGLPCNVNPILTFRMGMIGMACMGLGYRPNYKQGELFNDSIQEPIS